MTSPIERPAFPAIVAVAATIGPAWPIWRPHRDQATSGNSTGPDPRPVSARPLSLGVNHLHCGVREPLITVLVSDINQSPVSRLVRTSKGKLPRIHLMSYTKAFRDLWVPATSLIFTDFDLLSSFEMDVAGCIAATARMQSPQLRVLNDPVQVKERFALLHALNRQGISPVRVTRLETGDMPEKFPVFIRLEDGSLHPDTGLLKNKDTFSSGLSELKGRGKTLKRRIAVSFENQADSDGFFRKYGAFRIGNHIVPQHILRSKDWMVKSNRAPVSKAFVEEELAFVQNNPFHDELMKIFEIANIQFGRVDFTITDGRIAVFEINTNPHFPRFTGGNPAREARRQGILEKLAQAFEEIDAGPPQGRLEFCPDAPTVRYTKKKRWNWAERQAWKLRLRRRRKQDGTHVR